MRLAVLPREVAGRIITSAIARGAWAVNAASIALTIPILVEFAIRQGDLAALPVCVPILAGLVLLAVFAFFRPVRWVALVYLPLAAAGTVVYQLTLLAVHPTVQHDALFLFNRPAVSLVLIGVAGTSTLSGILWITMGLAVSTITSFLVAAVARVPLLVGWGPVLLFLLYLAAYLALEAIQGSQRRRLPNFEELEEETRRLAREENLRARIAAAVHDTLLNDLSIVMTAPDEIDERVSARLRSDIATLTSPEWLHESAEVVVTDDQDSSMRNQMMLMISDLQWRGLTVHVTGSGSGIYRLAADAATAIVDAIRACLENVLRHSGTNVAELDLAYTPDEVTVIVSDEGDGFDPDEVADDRLGLRHSIVERIRAVGGSVKIWSTPGEGTSVIMRVPVEELVVEHEASHHEATTPEGDDSDAQR